MFRVFSKIVRRGSTSFAFYSTNYPKEAHVVRSKLPDVQIPNILLNEYIWKDIDKWKDKTALVRSVEIVCMASDKQSSIIITLTNCV